MRSAAPPRATDVVRGYVALTKPRIIELLLVTTVPSMIVAAGGVPPLGTAAATLTAGTLAAGSANTLNCYLDRDLDESMRRTRQRPLPRGEVSPRGALVFGATLGLISLLIFAITTNVLTTALCLSAIVIYVFGYSMWLKRRTPQNIVWGGTAGCLPVLIGWSAVTGSLTLVPVLLFLVVFFWTPPHFWALALRFRADYADAGIPMLPVVASPAHVGRQIVGYAWATVAASLLVWPLATSWLYGVCAVGLGTHLLRCAHDLNRSLQQNPSADPMRLFRWSTRYLGLLFAALAIDALAL